MSYDYDYMYADWDEGILEITIGSRTYIYDIYVERDLWEGGKANGVEREEHGTPPDTEDREIEPEEEGTMFRRRFTPFEQHFRPY